MLKLGMTKQEIRVAIETHLTMFGSAKMQLHDIAELRAFIKTKSFVVGMEVAKRLQGKDGK